ncbi:sulfurtransferase [Roseovarius faecimaris]|uniref:Sulfurtransferase n=1 Tax=Roseovarius faecimaris TaxID=2494550 RepID=A0A6I6IPP7_9RHOB|nr:rhodanese-like domain-containing protein [Roseovarius faecimaris]QGX98104.1 sulfurtransferase [Roseovarius faecimaris]
MTFLTRLLTAPLLAFSLVVAAPAATFAQSADTGIETSLSSASLPKGKRTQAGLYLTAAEAAGVLAARDDVLLIDVRTPEETVIAGYATDTDANIPLALFDPSHAFNAKKNRYKMMPNRGFAGATKRFLAGRDPSAVLVICRSGGRSAAAVDILIKAGVDVPLYSVVDGFEGDKNKDGRREVNGWKNAGAPWTYTPRAGLLISTD